MASFEELFFMVDLLWCGLVWKFEKQKGTTIKDAHLELIT